MSNEEQSTCWTGGQNAFGAFAPAMAHYTDKVLFDADRRHVRLRAVAHH